MTFPDINCPHRTKEQWFSYEEPEEPEDPGKVHKKKKTPLDRLFHYFDPVSRIKDFIFFVEECMKWSKKFNVNVALSIQWDQNCANCLA